MSIELVEFLKTVRIFEQTPETELVSIAPQLQAMRFDPGTPIIHKGDLGDCMFIIVNGRVKVHDGERLLNYMGPGEAFGEMALLDDEPRVASVTAAEQTQVMRLKRETFFHLITRSPGFGRGILHEIATNIRNNIRQLRSDFAFQIELEREMVLGHHADLPLTASQDLVDFLKSVRIFAQTPEEELISIASSIDVMTVPAGETIMRKGDLGDSMYILREGHVRVHDGDQDINLMGPGDAFGEMALLDDEPRVASVTTTETAILLRLNRGTFFKLITRSPGFGQGVLNEIATNIRNNVRQLRGEYEKQLSLAHKLQDQQRKINEGQGLMISLTSGLAEDRDKPTGRHLQRVREYCRILAEQYYRHPLPGAETIDQKFIALVQNASPLHDIGKVGIPDRILQKPGKLEPDEFELMKSHTTRGAMRLRAVLVEDPDNELIRMGIEITESHHERWDGNGYPKGLAGKEIPLSGRIMALADVYDALTSQRPYKEPWSHQDSRTEIVKGSGSHFDPVLVQCFLLAEDEFLEVCKRLQDLEVPSAT